MLKLGVDTKIECSGLPQIEAGGDISAAYLVVALNVLLIGALLAHQHLNN